MAIKAFGTQGFLNPVSSADSGWFKLSVRGSKNKRYLGRVNSKTMLADCSQHIELEFDVWGVDNSSDNIKKENEIKTTLAFIAARRVKVKKFRKAIIEYTDALLAAYDEAEAELRSHRP